MSKERFPFKSAVFLKSVFEKKEMLRPRFAEITFCGRSNVGKSSLINDLLRDKKLAKVSATPGKTRSVNFFEVDTGLLLVDLPGYGFAKAPKGEIEKWQSAIEEYFESRKEVEKVPLLLLILVDSRIGPTPLDHQMIQFAEKEGFAFLIVLTKVDKLSKSRSELKPIIESLSLEYFLSSDKLISYSVKEGSSRDFLIKQINEKLTGDSLGKN